METVIQKATAKNREERFASMNDFATALTDAVPSDSSLDAYDSGNDPGLADAQTIVRAEALPLEKTAHRASPYGRGGEGAAPPRKNLGLAIGIGAGAVALLGAGLLAFSGGKTADEVVQPEPVAARGGAAPAIPPPDEAKPPPAREEGMVAVPPIVEPPRSDLGAVRVMADTGIFTQAQNEFLAGRLETAEKMLQSLAADSPLKDQASDLRAKVEEVNGLMQRAGAAYQRGQCGQAIKVYQEVLKKNAGMQAAAAGISRCKQQMPAAVLE
jgi:serine/threonine-protein kinase